MSERHANGNPMKRVAFWISICAIGLIAVLLFVARIIRRQSLVDISDAQSQRPAQLNFTSGSVGDGAVFPKQFTCQGANTSPDIQFPNPPAGTKSFAIVLDDPDAPLGFVHWLVYKISATTREIPEGSSSQGKLPPGVDEGVNSFGNMRYDGPCPPAGKPHHYRLRLYALDNLPALPRGATKKQLAAAVTGHVLAEGQITATYARNAQ